MFFQMSKISKYSPKFMKILVADVDAKYLECVTTQTVLLASQHDEVIHQILG